jgi:hypothetical protein
VNPEIRAELGDELAQDLRKKILDRHSIDAGQQSAEAPVVSFGVEIHVVMSQEQSCM